MKRKRKVDKAKNELGNKSDLAVGSMNLPGDLLSYLFAFLDVPTLLRVRLVSKHCLRIANKPSSLRACKFDFRFTQNQRFVQSFLKRYSQIHRITLGSHWQDQDLICLLNCANHLQALENLCFENCQLSKKSLQFLPRLTSLLSLEVGAGSQISGGDLHALTEMSKLTSLCLRSVQEVNVAFVTDDSNLHFRNQFALLDLSCTDLNDFGLSFLPTSLVKLNLSNCRRLTGERIPSFPMLKELNLGGAVLLTDVGVDRVVSGCPNLESLKLSWTKFVTHTHHISRLKKLKSLQLRALKSLGNGLGPLQTLSCSLVRLDAARNPVFDANAVSKLENLTELDANYSGIEDEGLLLLSSLTRLQVLRLKGCKKLSASNLSAFFKSITSLREIELSASQRRQLCNSKENFPHKHSSRKPGSFCISSGLAHENSDHSRQKYHFCLLQFFYPSSLLLLTYLFRTSHYPISEVKPFPYRPSSLTPCEFLPKLIRPAETPQLS